VGFGECLEWLLRTTGDKAGLAAAQRLFIEQFPHQHCLSNFTNMPRAGRIGSGNAAEILALRRVAFAAYLYRHYMGLPLVGVAYQAEHLFHFPLIVPAPAAVPAARAGFNVPGDFPPALRAGFPNLEATIALFATVAGQADPLGANFDIYTPGELAVLVAFVTDIAFDMDELVDFGGARTWVVPAGVAAQNLVASGLHRTQMDPLPAAGVSVHSIYAAASGATQWLAAIVNATNFNKPVLRTAGNIANPRILQTSLVIASVQIRCIADSVTRLSARSEYTLALAAGDVIPGMIPAVPTPETMDHIKDQFSKFEQSDLHRELALTRDAFDALQHFARGAQPISETLHPTAAGTGWDIPIAYSAVIHQVYNGTAGTVGGLLKDTSVVGFACAGGRNCLNGDYGSSDLCVADRVHAVTATIAPSGSQLGFEYHFQFHDGFQARTENVTIGVISNVAARYSGTAALGEIVSSALHSEILDSIEIRMRAVFNDMPNQLICNWISHIGARAFPYPNRFNTMPSNTDCPDLPNRPRAETRVRRAQNNPIAPGIAPVGGGLLGAMSDRAICEYLYTNYCTNSRSVVASGVTFVGLYDSLAAVATPGHVVVQMQTRGLNRGLQSMAAALCKNEEEAKAQEATAQAQVELANRARLLATEEENARNLDSGMQQAKLPPVSEMTRAQIEAMLQLLSQQLSSMPVDGTDA